MKIISAKEKSPKGTVTLTLTIPWSEASKAYNKVLEKERETTELPGFRKGKAPLSQVEKKVGVESLLQEALQELLPQAYSQAVDEHQLKPIIPPKVELVSLEKGQEWQLKATTCEAPETELGDYQEKVKESLQGKKIWVPGQKKKKKEVSQTEKLNLLFKTLLESIKLDLPEILLEQETNRLLANFLDQTRQLGLTLQDYLSSRQKTAEQLRQEQQQQAEKSLKLEFILEAIADDLQIQVEEKEIEELMEKTAKDKKEKERLAGQKYSLASLLRRRKTIDKLLSL